MFGPVDARPIILKGWQMGCEERPFYIKGLLVGWEGMAEMGCGLATEGIKGVRAHSLSDEAEWKLGLQRRLHRLVLEMTRGSPAVTEGIGGFQRLFR